jgi:xanthine dehydrogenase small subunit
MTPGDSALHPEPNQIVVGGGTDLYVQRPNDLSSTDIFLVPPIEGPRIWSEGGLLHLAGTATAEDMKNSDLLKKSVGEIDRAMTLMGSLPIRNMASVAGNLANASPIGDMTIILLALDAEICLEGCDSPRVIPLPEFFKGYKEIDLRPGELVKWIRFPADRDGSVFNFEKVSKRTHLDIASVNTAISIQVDGDRIVQANVSAGGIAPIPLRLKQTSSFLAARTPDSQTAFGAAEIARSEVEPISDVRGSAEYKRVLLGRLVLAHFDVLFDIGKDLADEVFA